MNRLVPLATVVACAVLSIVAPPAASAEDVVTYEVVSPAVGSATIEYQTAAGRMVLPNVALPWRLTVPVREAQGPPPDGSQVRADWRPTAGPSKWVSVRVYHNDELICQNTLDVGNAACYGSTRRIT